MRSSTARRGRVTCHSTSVGFGVDAPRVGTLLREAEGKDATVKSLEHPDHIRSTRRLGHAEYNDFLVVYQNVTVRSASPHISIGKGVVLSAGATILGNKPVGARSAIGAHTMIFDREIPPDSIVFTDATGQQQTRPRKHACSAQRFFNVEID